MDNRPGILAIWNDCVEGEEAAYEAWYHGEHLIERVSIPGFLTARRYVAIDGTPAYMTCYETEWPSVLTSEAYRVRVDNPTPGTRRMMTEVFRNVIRTVCVRSECRGAVRGAFCVAARFDRAEAPTLSEVADPHLLRAERWERVEPLNAAVSQEETLRGADRKIAGCLIANTSSEDAARAVAEAWRKQFGQMATIGGYRLISSLCHEELNGVDK